MIKYCGLLLPLLLHATAATGPPLVFASAVVGVVTTCVIAARGLGWGAVSLEMGLQAFSSSGLSFVLALLFLR